ncbi:DUF4439 domain-containing protein [Arthrobacter sp. 35W]|uniref:DUF4439 domain-containing protein n=1 Tax=Arthrobacter sp. 35W TaxID=1132441 RepID=UPI00041785B3|nr:DUF4439 domain-containing protein [Arthrobacter sp. 35W]
MTKSSTPADRNPGPSGTNGRGKPRTGRKGGPRRATAPAGPPRDGNTPAQSPAGTAAVPAAAPEATATAAAAAVEPTEMEMNVTAAAAKPGISEAGTSISTPAAGSVEGNADDGAGADDGSLVVEAEEEKDAAAEPAGAPAPDTPSTESTESTASTAASTDADTAGEAGQEPPAPGSTEADEEPPAAGSSEEDAPAPENAEHGGGVAEPEDGAADPEDAVHSVVTEASPAEDTEPPEPATPAEAPSTPEPLETLDAAEPTEPAGTSDAPALEVSEASAAPEAPESADAPAPQSRRALRAAEQSQQGGSTGQTRAVAAAPAKRAAKDTAAASPAATDVKSEPAATAPTAVQTPPAKGKAWRMTWHALLLVVVAVLVLALGTVVAKSPTTPAEPSATELARLASLDSARVLAAQVDAVSSTAAPELAQPLSTTAAILATEIAALTITTTPASPAATGTAAPPAIADVPTLVASLAASANTALDAAGTADGAMGRLLASVGTGQLLQARSLASAAGLPLPASSHLVPANTAPSTSTAASTPSPPASAPASGSAQPPACTARTAAPGTNDGQSLVAAAAAEQRAVYAYQVSATRFPEPAFTQAVAMLDSHQRALSALSAQLRKACLPVPAGAPGYALDPAFTASPATALAGLEAQLSVVYGDLAALSLPSATAGSVRSTAVDSLLRTAHGAVLWGGPVSPLPGFPGAMSEGTATATAGP